MSSFGFYYFRNQLAEFLRKIIKILQGEGSASGGCDWKRTKIFDLLYREGFSFWVEGVVGQSVLNLVFRKINHLVLLSILNLIYEFFHF